MDSGLQKLGLKIFGGLSTSYDSIALLGTLMQDRYWKSWVVRNAGIRPGATVLDIGFGTGMLEEYLGGSGATVVGVDLTEAMVRVARGKDVGLLTALNVGDAEHLPFRDSQFDLILSCYVVKYCNAWRFASEMARVLKPGGTFVIYDFTRPRGPFAPFHAAYVYGAMRIFGFMLRRVDGSLALTYEALPSLIKERRWDDTFGATLRACGFSQVGKRALTGGVVTVFWGTRGEEDASHLDYLAEHTR